MTAYPAQEDVPEIIATAMRRLARDNPGWYLRDTIAFLIHNGWIIPGPAVHDHSYPPVGEGDFPQASSMRWIAIDRHSGQVLGPADTTEQVRRWIGHDVRFMPSDGNHE